MRTTHLRDVNLIRKIPYDVNFHGLVEQDYDFNVEALTVSENEGIFRLHVKVTYVVKDTKAEMGEIVAHAETKIQGPSIPRDEKGNFRQDEASEELLRVIEGAVGEDILIPLAGLARAAKLPSVFPIPFLFARKDHKGHAHREHASEGEPGEDRPKRPSKRAGTGKRPAPK